MIRNAEKSDLPRIGEIYLIAKQFMKNTGNPTQWAGAYPETETLEKDIEKNSLFVMYDENEIYGVFYLYIGEDPTYNYIEGSWLDRSEYGTIHRIASSGTHKGVLHEAVEFSSKKIKHLRIDTHFNNTVMQNAVIKQGFSERGIIYIDNGEPRIVYEKIKTTG